MKYVSETQKLSTRWKQIRGVYFVWEFLYLPQFFLKPSTIKNFFCPSGLTVKLQPLVGRSDVGMIGRFEGGKARRSEGGKVWRSEGGKVGRLKGWRFERLEGRRLERLEGPNQNLMEAYTFHNSFLIPSTHKFFVGDLRSPTTNKIYSPAWMFDECLST